MDGPRQSKVQWVRAADGAVERQYGKNHGLGRRLSPSSYPPRTAKEDRVST
jgi:hypothetical protein